MINKEDEGLLPYFVFSQSVYGSLGIVIDRQDQTQISPAGLQKLKPIRTRLRKDILRGSDLPGIRVL